MSRHINRILAIVLLIASWTLWGVPMSGATLPAGCDIALLVLISAVALYFAIAADRKPPAADR